QTGYAFHPWKSAELLSQSIVAGHINVSNRRIIELGAGTGLCGITALSCGASWVTFTDVNEPLIEENILRNVERANLSKCSFAVCDWNDIPEVALTQSFDVILASDCLRKSLWLIFQFFISVCWCNGDISHTLSPCSGMYLLNEVQDNRYRRRHEVLLQHANVHPHTKKMLQFALTKMRFNHIHNILGTRICQIFVFLITRSWCKVLFNVSI
ncbi:unnamed protein product, partial [Mesocestoides corti]